MKHLFLFIILAVAAFAQPEVKTNASVPYAFGYSNTITATWTDTLTRELDSLVQIASGSSGWGQCNSLFDTLTSTITPVGKYWTASIVADDTCVVSTNGGFPAYNTIILLPNLPLTVGPFNAAQTNLYIKRRPVSGATGNPIYYIYFLGW